MKLKADITENELRFRLAKPKLFRKLRSIVLTRKKGIYAIIGRRRGETKTTVQSIRFKKKKGWKEVSARKWLFKKYFKNNPVMKARNKPIKIYERILAVYAVKSKGSNFPGEKFVHKFSKKHKASIYGMPDGSLLIKGKVPLWKNFRYTQ